MVRYLLAAGVAAGRAELGQTLTKMLAGSRPLPTLTGVLSAAPTVDGFTQLSRLLTPYELGAVVRTLAQQGSITANVGETLLNDLRSALGATTATARAVALAQFRTHVAAVTGPAGALLAAGGASLS